MEYWPLNMSKSNYTFYECSFCKSPTVSQTLDALKKIVEIRCRCCGITGAPSLLKTKKEFLELKINNEVYSQMTKMYGNSNKYTKWVFLEDSDKIKYCLKLESSSGIKTLCKLTDDNYRKCKVKFTTTRPLMATAAYANLLFQSLVILEVI